MWKKYTTNQTTLIEKEIETTKLLSPEGSKIFARRKILVEPVFGQVKANLGFTRFYL